MPATRLKVRAENGEVMKMDSEIFIRYNRIAQGIPKTKAQIQQWISAGSSSPPSPQIVPAMAT